MKHFEAMSNIVGNIALKERLGRDVLSGSLSHAYILEGADGSGRRSIALYTAAAQACKNKKNGVLPCLNCDNCRKIVDLKSPDVIFLGSNGKATVGVDAARFLKEDVYTIPNDLDDKFYIIEDADKMTLQAQNALLLTLEEPPEFVHFFLLCNNASSLLETIRSRAPTLRTEPLSDGEVDAYICKASNAAVQLKSTSKNEYEELIKTAHGSIGKALELLEPKNRSAVIEQRLFAKKFINIATSRCGAEEMLPVLSEFSSKRDILNDQLSLILSAVRDLIVTKRCDCPPLCFYCNTDEAIEICDRASMSFLFTLQQVITTAIDECKRNANVRLLLMKMAISAQLI